MKRNWTFGTVEHNLLIYLPYIIIVIRCRTRRGQRNIVRDRYKIKGILRLRIVIIWLTFSSFERYKNRYYAASQICSIYLYPSKSAFGKNVVRGRALFTLFAFIFNENNTRSSLVIFFSNWTWTRKTFIIYLIMNLNDYWNFRFIFHLIKYIPTVEIIYWLIIYERPNANADLNT